MKLVIFSLQVSYKLALHNESWAGEAGEERGVAEVADLAAVEFRAQGVIHGDEGGPDTVWSAEH